MSHSKKCKKFQYELRCVLVVEDAVVMGSIESIDVSNEVLGCVIYCFRVKIIN